MNIKQPAAYDVSHYKIIPNFIVINPKPILMLTKATEGTSYVDETFTQYASGMMLIGCTRGFYHFHRKAFSPTQQAQHFINTISTNDLLSSDILVLDVEEGGETAAQLWTWLETVRHSFPNNLLMIYSRANILNPIAMTASEKEYFRNVVIWTAGYPFFPDLYSVVPSGYIPDQSKWGPVWMWQYSSHGVVTGISGDVDCNWISPTFQAYLEANKIDFGEVTMASYSGKCTTTAKVWNAIGGERVYPDVSVNTPIRADAKQGEYLHLISPVIGWSKAVWFYYVVDSNPPPPPPPPPPVNIELEFVEFNGKFVGVIVLTDNTGQRYSVEADANGLKLVKE
jgi:GH25 family lysozyme M1 (1,4-beta-N-acetylmuramidase)